MTDGATGTTTQQSESQQVGGQVEQTEAPETKGGDDLRELVQGLNEKFDQRFPEETEETSTRDPLIDFLAGGDEEGDGTEVDDDYGLEAFDVDDGQGDQVMTQEELDEHIAQQIGQHTSEFMLHQELEKRRAELTSLQEEHPELGEPEMRDKLRGILLPLAERYGNPHVATDPELVMQAFKAIKADEISAEETPAEEAANRGASLETGAGPGSQGQSDDPDAEFKKRLLGTASGSDAFS